MCMEPSQISVDPFSYSYSLPSSFRTAETLSSKVWCLSVLYLESQCPQMSPASQPYAVQSNQTQTGERAWRPGRQGG